MATRYPKTCTHPSSMLKDFLNEYGLTIEQAAKMLDIPLVTLANFLKGKSKMSKALAYRLDLAGIADAQSWLNLQTGYDMVKFVNTETKKPKVAVAAFEKIRKEIDARVQKELEAEKEIDELLMRKLERLEQERKRESKNAKSTKPADDELGDTSFAEITPVRRVREHARAHA